MNVLDGGRDEPLEPMTARQRWAVGLLATAAVAVSVAVILLLG